MTKGRNAAKAFTATRGARFGEAAAEREQQQAQERAEGTRRSLLDVGLQNVRDDDEVSLTAGGFGLASDNDRSTWASFNGRTFVRRFLTAGA